MANLTHTRGACFVPFHNKSTTCCEPTCSANTSCFPLPPSFLVYFHISLILTHISTHSSGGRWFSIFVEWHTPRAPPTTWLFFSDSAFTRARALSHGRFEHWLSATRRSRAFFFLFFFSIYARTHSSRAHMFYQNKTEKNWKYTTARSRYTNTCVRCVNCKVACTERIDRERDTVQSKTKVDLNTGWLYWRECGDQNKKWIKNARFLLFSCVQQLKKKRFATIAMIFRFNLKDFFHAPPSLCNFMTNWSGAFNI